MSLYTQNYYGQPPHGGHAYTAPTSQSGYQYQYSQQLPHPQPIPPASHPVFIDPATFRRDYSNRLDQLQFNSRPIIQHLSYYAQEYSRYADIVAQCLDSHIRKVPPWMKLPAFYLLDAISKNVYDPYARVFASFVIPLFLDTYRTVDDNTRSKMDEMLLTWRTGAPHGKELFGLAPQMAIERGIWGDQAGPGQITKAQVLSELNFALQAKERAIQTNPNDVTAKHHTQVLIQLRNLVEAGVSQDELGQILTQLHGLVRPSSAQAPPPPQWHGSSLHPTSVPTTYPSHPMTFPSLYSVKSDTSDNATPESSALTEPAQLNITGILSTLLKSGLVSAPQGDTPATKPESTEREIKDIEPRVPTVEDLSAATDAQSDYRKRILAEAMEASLVESSIEEPTNVAEFLYDYLTLQCQQCGIRYPDTILGKRFLEDHLDLHFRQNRKVAQNLGRGHDRSWFTNVEDWVHDSSSDRTPSKARVSKVKSVPENTAIFQQALRIADFKSQYVTVPPGDEAKPLSCPICKEVLQVEFLEDEEEWVWRNAIEKDDKIYHATCHAEASLSTNNLVTRLKTELGSTSRATTPEVFSSRSTPTMRITRSHSRSPPSSPSRHNGVKRKIELEDHLSLEPDHTPPLKKFALAQL